MAAVILKWIIVLLSLVNSCYMTYDGVRAIVTGDYMRPQTGEYAGQLAPWTKLAEKLGIDPMSLLMKSIFVFFGVSGLFITICFALNVSWSWKAMLVYNICSAWNLFFGTANSVLQIILLIILWLVK